jgi:hypothetical protein
MTTNAKKIPAIPPWEDRLLSTDQLAKRWDLHPKVCLLRIRKLGLPIVTFNSRSLAVRLSDVLKAETEATV